MARVKQEGRLNIGLENDKFFITYCPHTEEDNRVHAFAHQRDEAAWKKYFA